MPSVESLKELTELIANGGTALLAAILLGFIYFQRKDMEAARKEHRLDMEAARKDAEQVRAELGTAQQRVIELENRVFELSSAYNRTVRKFEGGFAQTRELLSRIYDRL